MADSSVSITAGTGTTVDTRTNAAGEHRQVMAIGNDGDVVAGIEPFGALTVNPGFTTLFYDSWTNALDTTDKWTVVGNAPTIANGNMQMSTTASSYNAIRTKDLVRPNVGFTYVANGISIETTTTTGAGRFWGLGIPASTPAAAVLAQDGIGFELDQATGSLLAVTYSAGVRTTVATLTRPTDGATHRYAMYFRVTAAYWYVDNLQVPVASATFPTVTVVELPALLVRQNAASFTGTPVFTSIAHVTADTSSHGRSITDPVIGTRMARVDSYGSLQANSPAATTGTLGGGALSTTSSTFFNANSARKGAMVYNESTTATIYLALGSGASTTLYTVQIPPGGYWELPAAGSVYTGIITGVASVASGNVRVTELT